MMNITLLALNSKYIHSSLALWYLKSACKDLGQISLLERTVNEPFRDIFHAVLETTPDVLCFSCYIWNIEYVKKLCRELKKVMPNTKFILGGPEVSFHAKEVMNEIPEVDIILLGEGEETLPAVLKDIDGAATVPGTVVRINGELYQNGSYQCIKDLDQISSPYTAEMLASLTGKLAYFESSRGCPFSCAYCLSCATDGVRYFSLDRVKKELLYLAQADVRTIKFVDRTFNANPMRAKEIISFILKNTGDITMHFEVGIDLFDEEILDLLKSAPPGKIQIEAGVQSTNARTLDAVSRKTSLDRTLKNLAIIRSFGNIHVHSDLICGLPYEDIALFHQSFDMLYQTQPHALQMGFLKMLHGSQLRKDAAKYNYVFMDTPPYEVICNRYLSAAELCKLHEIEDVLDKFYNSGKFTTTLCYVFTILPSPFAFYDALADYLSKQYGRYRHFSPEKSYAILHRFLNTIPLLDAERINTSLAFDFYCSNTSRTLPASLDEPDDDFVSLRSHTPPQYRGMSTKEIMKHAVVKKFLYDVTKKSLPAQKCTLLISREKKDAVCGRYYIEKL